MPEYSKHLYMTVFPNNALISSQLPPEAFSRHYVLGSAKHYKGKVVFVEIDINTFTLQEKPKDFDLEEIKDFFNKSMIYAKNSFLNCFGVSL